MNKFMGTFPVLLRPFVSKTTTFAANVPQKKALAIAKMSSSSADNVDENELIREASIPNETWTEKTKTLYNEFMDLSKDGGNWEKVTSFQNLTANERLFVRAVEEKGKMFEYAMFLNREEQRIRAVVQFGPWLQGPKGAVHGGAIATMFDSVGGVLAYQLGYRCVTVNLNVNFHGMLPISETVVFEGWFAKREGRKVYIDALAKSVEKGTVYSTSNMLWLEIVAPPRVDPRL